MQVRIEIDVKPEELRRFLGLPDVGGLQDDIVALLRDKVGAASEFDPAAFLKSNLDHLRDNPTLRRLLAGAKVRVDEATGDRESRGTASSKRAGTTGGGRSRTRDDDKDRHDGK